MDETHPLVAAFRDHLGRDRRRSPHTIRAYSAGAARFLAFLGQHQGGPPAIDGLASADVRAFLAKRRGEGLGNASAARELSAVRAFLTFHEVVPPRLRGPRVKRGVPRPLSPDDALTLGRTVEDEASEPWIGARDWALLLLLYGAGLRIGEARRWSLSRARMAELWGFSRHIAASSILGLVIMQTDKLVFAQTLPLAMFGLYSIATSLATAPTALAAPFCSGILYPGLSDDVRQGRDLKRTFYQRRRNMLMLYAFLLGGFIASAPLLVEILYDPRYREVATFMQILSIATLMIIVTATSSEVMIASGRQVWTFYSNIGRGAWLAAGVAATYALGEPTILIWTVGTIEVPAALVYWNGLARVRAFSLRQELLTPVAALGGYAVGAVGSAPILAWLVAGN